MSMAMLSSHFLFVFYGQQAAEGRYYPHITILIKTFQYFLVGDSKLG